MPEGPEVANVLAWLKTEIKDQKIVEVEILYSKLIQTPSYEQFKSQMIGEHFRFFHRLGKYLIFEMDTKYLVGHLRMEGKFLLFPSQEDFNHLDSKQKKHIHAYFTLEDGRILAYHDVRKFGRLALYDKIEDYTLLPSFAHVGKDVLDPTLSGEELFLRGKNKKRNIKAFLLDQSVMAGIGNIYADEILFASRLSPYTLTNALDLQDYKRLLEASQTILKEAMDHGGTTIRTFSYGGHPGSHQSHLKIHRKKACPICNTPLTREVVATRGTWYCPHCQKLKQ